MVIRDKESGGQKKGHSKNEENGVYTISAEVFGDGIDMWLRSQGDFIEILK